MGENPERAADPPAPSQHDSPQDALLRPVKGTGEEDAARLLIPEGVNLKGSQVDRSGLQEKRVWPSSGSELKINRGRT